MDEILMFVLLPCIGLIAAGVWSLRFLGWGLPFGLSLPQRLSLLGALLGALLLLGIILRAWSSADVRTDNFYLFGYWGVGLAWLAACLYWFFPLMGLDPRREAVERSNTATIWAFGGAAIGAILCYAGGNIGNGPGWWVVIFCLLLASLHWLFFWWLLDAVTHITDVITIDRDRAAGLRLGGFLVGTGLLVGRAVAGDWVNVNATVYDFLYNGWPALIVIYIIAALIERSAQPTLAQPRRPLIRYGLLPAGTYIGSALLFAIGLFLWHKGW